jgi:hypothetical protein
MKIIPFTFPITSKDKVYVSPIFKGSVVVIGTAHPNSPLEFSAKFLPPIWRLLTAVVISPGVAIPASVKVLLIHLLPSHLSISPAVFPVMVTLE